MNVRYACGALAQIDEAMTYVEARSPQGAVHLRDRIVALVTLLREQPYAGRMSTRPNIRPHSDESPSLPD